MPSARRLAPTWLIGLTTASFGFYGGLVAIAIPELLAARHIAPEIIARLTAFLLVPGAACFLLAPILDVRFSRRAWAVLMAAVGTVALIVAFLNLGRLAVFEGAIFVGYMSLNLYQAACGGWFASVVADERQPVLSSWTNVGNIGAGGLMATFVTELLRVVPLPVASVIFGALILLPTAVFPFIPAPGPDRMLASESFRSLFRAVFSMLRRREVLLTLLLFGLPSSCFTLTNLVAGYGNFFHATERQTSLLGGAGVAIAGIVAALLGGPLCRRFKLRRLYLVVGIVGGLFTLSLLLLPHTPLVFGVVMVGENGFQALAFTVATAITLKTVGHGNAVAATEYGFLTCASNFPLIYMEFVEGHVFKMHGLRGVFGADGLISLMACLGLLGLLWWVGRKGRGVVVL